MLAVSGPLVTCGYFQKHLWVILGLCSLATAALLGEGLTTAGYLSAAAAAAAYVGSVVWLYDRRPTGRVLLVLVSATALLGAWSSTPATPSPWSADLWGRLAQAAVWLDPLAGGLVLGSTMAAMLLGHWYLNTPTMALAPLQRLVQWMGVSILLRAISCLLGLLLFWHFSGTPSSTLLCFVALRWLAGIFGAAVVVVMTWYTLKIPNTQSATGILYVGVIVTFLGELTAQLLSQQSPVPL